MVEKDGRKSNPSQSGSQRPPTAVRENNHGTEAAHGLYARKRQLAKKVAVSEAAATAVKSRQLRDLTRHSDPTYRDPPKLIGIPFAVHCRGDDPLGHWSAFQIGPSGTKTSARAIIHFPEEQ
jgi:hypothetical protein